MKLTVRLTFDHRGGALGNHCIRDWLGLKVVPDVLEKKKFLAMPKDRNTFRPSVKLCIVKPGNNSGQM